MKAEFSSGAIRAFCRDTFLPYWAARSIDHEFGGFIDRLDLSGRPVALGYKRMRVQGRQLFVLSHAAEAGLLPRGGDMALEALEFVRSAFWDTSSGGWRYKVSPDGGTVIDDSKQLYCQAFALFGLSAALAATGDQAVRADIENMVHFVDSVMADPLHGGFVNSAPPALPRIQNPHMHLLEAYLALFEVTQDRAFMEKARAIVELWLERFTPRGEAPLLEYFNADWTPAEGRDGARVEPGHQMEWYWLLYGYARLAGAPAVAAPATAMMRWCLAHGLDNHRDFPPALFDEIDRNGAVLQASKCLWPQTEMIKAMLAAFEWTGERDYLERAEASLALLLGYYFPERDATFREHLDRDGQQNRVDFMPVSSVYHIYLALSEWIRVVASVEAAQHVGPGNT